MVIIHACCTLSFVEEEMRFFYLGLTVGAPVVKYIPKNIDIQYTQVLLFIYSIPSTVLPEIIDKLLRFFDDGSKCTVNA